jgi:hypothetical protein
MQVPSPREVVEVWRVVIMWWAETAAARRRRGRWWRGSIFLASGMQ